MIKKYLTLIIISFAMLFFSGCGSPDCSEQDTTYLKYSLDEETKECIVSKEIPKDECGNGIYEKGETFCNCPEDVSKTAPSNLGGCDGEKSEFLEATCDGSECVYEETKKVTMTSKVFDYKSSSYFNIETKVNYKNPFMIDRHSINLEFMLKDYMDTDTMKIRDLTIKNINVVTGSNELLGSKIADLKFIEQYESLQTNVALDGFSFEEFEKDMKNVYVKMLITYVKETYSKKDGVYSLSKSEPISIELKNSLDNNFIIINPENEFVEKK